MTDIKTIFNHPKKEDPEKDPGLYNWRKVFHGKNDAEYLNRLLRIKHQKKNTTPLFSPKPRTSGSYNNRKQRVMIKMSYGKSLSKHRKYIQLYMPQILKEGVDKPAELFGCNFKEYEKHMSPLHFKFIISPESQNVDLKLLSETFISHIEKLTGYEFYWLGAVHTDTDHNHVHISINGMDRHGNKVRFPKEMIKTTFREILSQITTNMIGERTQEEIENAKSKIIEARRWTVNDEKLKSMGEKIFVNKLNQSLTSRLQYLSSIGLAEKNGPYYFLKEDYEEVLRATGRYNLYLEEYLTSSLPLRLFEGGSIKGKVDKVISFDNDESWNDAIIIKTDKERLYIPVFQLHKENLEGKTVEIINARGGTNRNISDRDIRIIDSNKTSITKRKDNGYSYE